MKVNLIKRASKPRFVTRSILALTVQMMMLMIFQNPSKLKNTQMLFYNNNTLTEQISKRKNKNKDKKTQILLTHQYQILFFFFFF